MEQSENSKKVTGFSKLSKRGKLIWIVNNFFKDPEHVMKELVSYWHSNEDHQKIIDGMSENTISNFILPYSVAPNFVINTREYAVPLVIEVSSVVAAASKAAKYWAERGGFHARVISMIKEGNIYFLWKGDFDLLIARLNELEQAIRAGCQDLTVRMEARGGGLLEVELHDMTDREADYYKLNLLFNTCDSMGANFINSVLERTATLLKDWFDLHFAGSYFDVIMSILSNYTPRCLVEAWVECPVTDLTGMDELSAEEFAFRFHKAVRIAQVDVARATTHNKGIFNGIDGVVIATGNDFRAIEACGHTYAARSGRYSSLSECAIENGIFRFRLEIPLAVGTVGGLTSLHPIARRSLELLGNPTASELMQIIAVTGLAQNFAAVSSLVTTGIQKGHMRMHLQNIAWQLKADEAESAQIITHFNDKTISFAAVAAYLDQLRKNTANKISD